MLLLSDMVTYDCKYMKYSYFVQSVHFYWESSETNISQSDMSKFSNVLNSIWQICNSNFFLSAYELIFKMPHFVESRLKSEEISMKFMRPEICFSWEK